MDKMSSSKLKIKNYRDKVNVVIERLIYDLFKAQPDEYIDWMQDWLNTEGRKLHLQSTMNLPIPKTPVVYHVSSDEGEDDEIHDMPKDHKHKSIGRSAVSAEVYGQYNKKEDFQPRVIPKTEGQKKRIKEKLMSAFMFQALEKDEQLIVIDAMEEKKFEDNDWIIKQGDDGDELYVVDTGNLDCYRKQNNEEKLIKQYAAGDIFGELALLYNAPRAASIQSKGSAILFALDRGTFNNIVKESAIRRRDRFENVLSKVEVLKSMEGYEKMQICDALQEVSIKNGEWVIKEGEQGNKFYMVEKGYLVVYKDDQKNEVDQMRYSVGDYFGELALLENVPRQASIKAMTDVKLVYLDKVAFNRLLGPVEKILKRNAENYNRIKNA